MRLLCVWTTIFTIKYVVGGKCIKRDPFRLQFRAKFLTASEFTASAISKLISASSTFVYAAALTTIFGSISSKAILTSSAEVMFSVFEHAVISKESAKASMSHCPTRPSAPVTNIFS